MSLGLLLPAGLFALLALVVPILLHLDRRTQPQPTMFAALRWLSARLRPQRRLRLRERLLLASRLLLVALLALLLAGPQLYGVGAERPRVLIVPGVDLAGAHAALPDANARWQWLAPGLPDIGDKANAPPSSKASLSSLLRQADAELPAQTGVTVVVSATVSPLDAERPRLSRAIGWRVVSGNAALPASLPATTPPTLFLRSAPDRAASLRFLRAAAGAWHAGHPAAAAFSAADANTPLPPDARWAAWLGEGTIPGALMAWVQRGGILLVESKTDSGVPVWRDSDGRVLATATTLGRGRIIGLTRSLSPGQLPALAQAGFAEDLRRLFAGAPRPPDRADASAMRPVGGGESFAEMPMPLSPWLAVLIAALFVCERWLATRPRHPVLP